MKINVKLKKTANKQQSESISMGELHDVYEASKTDPSAIEKWMRKQRIERRKFTRYYLYTD